MLRDHLPAFVRHLEVNRAPRTVDNYRRAVEAFLATSEDGDAPTRGEVESFLARPRPDGAARARGTRQLELVALRVFFAWVARDHGTPDPTSGVKAPRRQRRDPVFPSIEETQRLFELAAEGPDSARNLAILGVLFGGGLRVGELVGLNADQVDVASGTLVSVVGKAGTMLDQVLCPRVIGLVTRWLEERRALGHPATGPLFPAARPATSSTGRLSVRSVQRLVRRLAVTSGSAKALSPHSLRHATATFSIALGTDVATTASLMRHASPATTMDIYVHALVASERRVAAARLGTVIPSSVLGIDTPQETGPPTFPMNTAQSSADRGAHDAVDILPS